MKAWTDSPTTKCFCAISCQDRHHLHHHCRHHRHFPPDSWSRTRQAPRFWRSRVPFALAAVVGTLTSMWGYQCDRLICHHRKVWSYGSSFQVSSHWYPIIQMDLFWNFWQIVYFLPVKSLFTILKVVTMDGNEVGKITKQWSGIARWNILNSKWFLFISKYEQISCAASIYAFVVNDQGPAKVGFWSSRSEEWK